MYCFVVYTKTGELGKTRAKAEDESKAKSSGEKQMEKKMSRIKVNTYKHLVLFSFWKIRNNNFKIFRTFKNNSFSNYNNS